MQSFTAIAKFSSEWECPFVFDGSGYTLVGTILLPALRLRWDEGLALLVTLRTTCTPAEIRSPNPSSGNGEIESGIPPSIKVAIQGAVRNIDVAIRLLPCISEHAEIFDVLWVAYRDRELIAIRYWRRISGYPSMGIEHASEGLGARRTVVLLVS